MINNDEISLHTSNTLKIPLKDVEDVIRHQFKNFNQKCIASNCKTLELSSLLIFTMKDYVVKKRIQKLNDMDRHLSAKLLLPSPPRLTNLKIASVRTEKDILQSKLDNET